MNVKCLGLRYYHSHGLRELFVLAAVQCQLAGECYNYFTSFVWDRCVLNVRVWERYVVKSDQWSKKQWSEEQLECSKYLRYAKLISFPREQLECSKY